MALYDYRCHKCGQTFEVRQRFADAELTVHEGCGGEVERLISAPALQFKGSGFYVTDYGRNGKYSASHSDSKPLLDTKPGPVKTETAPAAKPAAHE